jgi:hypothetical protein
LEVKQSKLILPKAKDIPNWDLSSQYGGNIPCSLHAVQAHVRNPEQRLSVASIPGVKGNPDADAQGRAMTARDLKWLLKR